MVGRFLCPGIRWVTWQSGEEPGDTFSVVCTSVLWFNVVCEPDFCELICLFNRLVSNMTTELIEWQAGSHEISFCICIISYFVV